MCLFEPHCNDPLDLTELQIGSLLFADDLIILSKCKIGLQNSLDNLSEYCDKWQLTMILQNNCVKPQNYFVKFKDNFLSNVKEYKYLGCMGNSNGSLVNSSLDLSKKTQKSIIFNKSIYI